MQVNCNEHIETYLAAAKLDAIFVPINFRARSEELSFMLNDSGTKVLIFGHRYQELVGAIKNDLKSVEHLIVLENRQEGFLFFDDLVDAASDEDKKNPACDGRIRIGDIL